MTEIEKLLLKGVSLDRNYEGHFEISWEPVDLQIKIIRTTRDYPFHMDAGEEVYSGSGLSGVFEDKVVHDTVALYSELPNPVTFSDQSLYSVTTDDGFGHTPGIYHVTSLEGTKTWERLEDISYVRARPADVHYYSIYYYDAGAGQWHTNPILKHHLYAIPMGVFIDIVRKRLIPRLYQVGWDVEDTPQSVAALVELIFTPPFEELRNLIAGFAQFMNVDMAPGRILGAFSQLVNWELNRELSINHQRQEIKQAVPLWKRKGRLDVLQDMCSAIAGAKCQLDEWGDNVLISNQANENYDDKDSIFFQRYNRIAAIDDPIYMRKKGLYGDVLSYSAQGTEPGTRYNFVDYGIYLKMYPTQGFTELQAEKIHAKVVIFSPLGSRGTLILWDERTENPGEFFVWDEFKLDLDNDWRDESFIEKHQEWHMESNTEEDESNNMPDLAAFYMAAERYREVINFV